VIKVICDPSSISRLANAEVRCEQTGATAVLRKTNGKDSVTMAATTFETALV
jgi:hypothetical protein